MVLPIIGAVVGVVSATMAVVKTATMKAQGSRARNLAIRQADEDRALAIRQGARDRLAASRVALINAQAEQAKLLVESRKSSNRLVIIGAGASLLILTVIGLRRK
jgi:hypothetical protein